MTPSLQAAIARRALHIVWRNAAREAIATGRKYSLLPF